MSMYYISLKRLTRDFQRFRLCAMQQHSLIWRTHDEHIFSSIVVFKKSIKVLYVVCHIYHISRLHNIIVKETTYLLQDLLDNLHKDTNTTYYKKNSFYF